MTAKEKSTARNFEYPNDPLTQRVKRALKSGRKMHLDEDGWYVDAKTGALIGPDPRIERPLTKAQLDRAELRHGDKLIRRGRPALPESERKQSVTLRLSRPVIEHFRATGPGWQTRIDATLERAIKRTAKRIP